MDTNEIIKKSAKKISEATILADNPYENWRPVPVTDAGLDFTEFEDDEIGDSEAWKRFVETMDTEMVSVISPTEVYVSLKKNGRE